MDRVHETYLKDTLRDVYTFGAATVEWRLIYRWFDAQRITRKVWAGLNDMWLRVLEEEGDEEGWRLAVVEPGRPDKICLVCLPAKDVELTKTFAPITTKFGD